MHTNLYFEIPTYTVDGSTFPKPYNENYDYWVHLLKYFLPKIDNIEIHCWNEEKEKIEEIINLYQKEIEITKEENLTIFRLNITSTISDFLLFNKLANVCELKWFTLNLNKGNKIVFHSGHWGTEFFVSDIIDKDITFIKSIMPTETSFYQY